jgi:hypothetical protein
MKPPAVFAPRLSTVMARAREPAGRSADMTPPWLARISFSLRTGSPAIIAMRAMAPPKSTSALGCSALVIMPAEVLSAGQVCQRSSFVVTVAPSGISAAATRTSDVRMVWTTGEGAGASEGPDAR